MKRLLYEVESVECIPRYASVTAMKTAPWQKSLDGWSMLKRAGRDGLDGWSMVKRVGTAHGAVRDDFDGG
jgi:hypothetical protein